MIKFATGNLLNDDAEALVNTVNTVGVMGKGMALMFKEAFPNNYKQYAAACKLEQVKIGKMFVTELSELLGPKWIINFPTKKHWRYPTKIAWIEEGLQDLIQIINEKNIRSVAIPPLGSGNGGLEWSAVREKIELALCQLDNVEVIIYEPTSKYQNIAKQSGVEKLTPARAMIAELVRRYWILGIECSLLEIHKLAWFLERVVEIKCAENPLKLNFQADKFGPYANRLDHLLNALDGSYLRCDKRIADANPLDIISFNDSKRDFLHTYLKSQSAKKYMDALDEAEKIIDGFQSPLGLELLATIDWLLYVQKVEPVVGAVRKALENWPGGSNAGARKQKIFDNRLIKLALERLTSRDLVLNEQFALTSS